MHNCELTFLLVTSSTLPPSTSSTIVFSFIGPGLSVPSVCLWHTDLQTRGLQIPHIEACWAGVLLTGWWQQFLAVSWCWVTVKLWDLALSWGLGNTRCRSSLQTLLCSRINISLATTWKCSFLTAAGHTHGHNVSYVGSSPATLCFSDVFGPCDLASLTSVVSDLRGSIGTRWSALTVMFK